MMRLLMHGRLCARWLRMSCTELQSSSLLARGPRLTGTDEAGLFSLPSPCYRHWQEWGRHPTQGLRRYHLHSYPVPGHLD